MIISFMEGKTLSIQVALCEKVIALLVIQSAS